MSDEPQPSAVRDVYVLARRNNEVLLLLRSGTGYKDQQWGPPSGKVEPGETYRQAAARELHEETGLHVEPRQLRFGHVIERGGGSGPPWVGFFFDLDCSGLEPVNREAHKHSDLAFFDASALPANTVDYVRHVIHAIKGGHLFSEWHADNGT